ncbi:hypothetical protein E2C01_089019 [Portunus trituberculatus]|uniref:Uncharacterized protein n=1 Tax=Portunus trituberculatus TaxID=210409 RepID=A0A5B7JNG2_PORTR|nr:hypothetical protein [Portunus trituberculatus]
MIGGEASHAHSLTHPHVTTITHILAYQPTTSTHTPTYQQTVRVNSTAQTATYSRSVLKKLSLLHPVPAGGGAKVRDS